MDAKPKALLERYNVAIPDVFHGPEVLRECLAKHTLPRDLQAAFDQADLSLNKSLAAVQQSLEHLDKTLVDAANNAASKMHHQLDQLRSRAARAELRQKSDIVSMIASSAHGTRQRQGSWNATARQQGDRGQKP